jgi:hypothetical protein
MIQVNRHDQPPFAQPGSMSQRNGYSIQPDARAATAKRSGRPAAGPAMRPELVALPCPGNRFRTLMARNLVWRLDKQTITFAESPSAFGKLSVNCLGLLKLASARPWLSTSPPPGQPPFRNRLFRRVKSAFDIAEKRR